MSEYDKPLYCGNGRKFETKDGRECFEIELDLGQLREAVNGPARYKIREFDTKAGPRKVIKLVAFPLKPENVSDRRTHSLKVDMFEPKKREGGDGGMPF